MWFKVRYKRRLIVLAAACIFCFAKLAFIHLAFIIMGTVPQPSLFAADHPRWLRFPDTSQPIAINIAAVKRSQIELVLLWYHATALHLK